jgi:3'-5' exoribonuclease
MANALYPSAAHFQYQPFRLIRIDRQELKSGFRMTALLHHMEENVTVSWTVKNTPDLRLKPGVIVSPRGVRSAVTEDGVIEISRLILLERPEASLNLFETVPDFWVKDEDLRLRAASLWNDLPEHFKGLFNTTFWCGDRFRRFCTGPSSLSGHHATENGNLRHSVEVAEIMQRLLPQYTTANLGVSVMAGLMHDAGKAEEYDERWGKMIMSNRGKLLGHKITAVEWLAVARSRMRSGVPESDYLSLMHALTAAQNAPAYLGLRDAVTPEAIMLSLADRASGKADLFNDCHTPGGGWGTRHPHLKGAPYAVYDRATTARLLGIESLSQKTQHDQNAKH